MSNKGGRPSKPLDGYREIIQHYYLNTDYTAKQILNILQDEYDCTVSLRTFKTFIAQQGFKRNLCLDDTPALRMRITTCFYLLALEEHEILAVLLDEGKHQSFYIISYFNNINFRLENQQTNTFKDTTINGPTTPCSRRSIFD